MSEPTPTAARSSAGFLVRLTAVTLVVTCLAVATGFWWANRHDRTPEPDGQPKAAVPDDKPGGPAFAGWPKEAPDMVIVLSGQTYGYLQPCGCSRPQQGGLERRYNFIQQLKAKGWNVVALDVGDVLPKPPEAGDPEVPADQTYKKYEYAMKALKEMGYAAAGLGEYDFKKDPFQLLPRYTLNNPDKRPFLLAGNVVGAERDGAGKVTKTTPRAKFFGSADGKPDGRDAVGVGVVVAEKDKLPLGVVGLTAPSVANAITKDDKEGPYHFEDYNKHLTAALTAFAQHPAKPELNILLLQGTATEAQQAAQNFPGVQLIACLSDSSEPPGVPVVDPKTNQHIIQTGWKGRYVGVVGVFKTPKGFDFKYQLVALGEEYLTPDKAEKDNKALQLLEEYAKDVKDSDLLKQYAAKKKEHPAQLKYPKAGLKYIGSEACAKCHVNEYKVWSEHKHSHAYEALEKLAKRPALQNFNGECLVCHTTGFRYQTGAESKEKTPLLLNNGCENCHGPGSAHAAEPKKAEFIAEMLPWRLGPTDKLPAKAVLEKYGSLPPLERDKDVTMPAATKNLVNVRIAKVCMSCHDGDNDPKFDAWTYLPKIYHSNMKAAGLPGGAK